MPHGDCYLWKPEIVWLHALSDGTITLAYDLIPLALVYFVRKRKDLPFHWIFLMFGIFIFGCGTTHLMEVWTLWHGTYRLAGVIKAITAVASVATAAALVPLIPKGLALPSPEQLKVANLELEQEANVRRRAEAGFVVLAVVVFLVLVYPKYRARFDSTNARSQAVSFAERKAYLDAYRWILSNTKPVDVFLSLNGDLDLSIVGPADRKVVVTSQPEFSNPYVDWASRSNTASQIVDKLTSAPADALADLVANDVNYIITAPIGQFDREPFSFLSKEFAADDVVIYKVRTDVAR